MILSTLRCGMHQPLRMRVIDEVREQLDQLINRIDLLVETVDFSHEVREDIFNFRARFYNETHDYTLFAVAIFSHLQTDLHWVMNTPAAYIGDAVEQNRIRGEWNGIRKLIDKTVQEADPALYNLDRIKEKINKLAETIATPNEIDTHEHLRTTLIEAATEYSDKKNKTTAAMKELYERWKEISSQTNKEIITFDNEEEVFDEIYPDPNAATYYRNFKELWDEIRP